jgi:hypothetical protein
MFLSYILIYKTSLNIHVIYRFNKAKIVLYKILNTIIVKNFRLLQEKRVRIFILKAFQQWAGHIIGLEPQVTLSAR